MNVVQTKCFITTTLSFQMPGEKKSVSMDSFYTVFHRIARMIRNLTIAALYCSRAGTPAKQLCV